MAASLTFRQRFLSHIKSRRKYANAIELPEKQKKSYRSSTPLCDHTLHMPSTQSTPEASLHRQLRLRDLVLTQVLCVVGSSWVGIAAGLGRAQALTWIAAQVLLYLPMAVSVIYLNREMPLEGGLYVWARTA